MYVCEQCVGWFSVGCPPALLCWAIFCPSIFHSRHGQYCLLWTPLFPSQIIFFL